MLGAGINPGGSNWQSYLGREVEERAGLNEAQQIRFLSIEQLAISGQH